jgi:cytochrome P450
MTVDTAYPIGASASLDQLESDPHALFARLRAAEPVSWLPALDGWLVTRRDLALQVMRDDDAFTVDDPRFATARVVGPSMLSVDGAEHGRHRDPFARPFRLAAVRERFTGPVAQEVDRLIDALDDGRAELRRELAGPLAAAIVMRALGLDGADTAAVLRWYDAIVDSTSGLAAGRALTRDGSMAFSELSAAIESVLDHGGDSLLAVAAGDAGGLRPDQVVSNAAVLMFGGIETTEGMIANAILHLLSHPGELERVRADPALVAGAVEESLRLEPAAATVDRYATRDIEIGGATVQAGDLVTVSIAAANRDPDVFPNPGTFDVSRANARLHLAFAHGPHVCIGMHLARIEAQTAVARVLERLPGLRLDDPPAAAPRGLVFRKPPALAVSW